ncbi:hypothetical protein ACHWQZ_G000454 [Mnemiopsis leidyi]
MLHVLLAGLLITCLSRVHAHCVTYGDCDGLPCVNSTSALPMFGEQGRNIVSELCPHLKGGGKFCCDDHQVKVLKSSISKADSLLSGCKSAKENFRSLLCDMVCGPEQSDYLQVEKMEQHGGKTRATHLRYFLSTTYSDKVWKSTKTQSTLLCGHLFSSCSKDDLFGFLGNNRWTKLRTDYVIGDDPPARIVHASHEHMSCGSETCVC